MVLFGGDMQSIIKVTLYSFVRITILTALLAIGGIIYTWTTIYPDETETQVVQFFTLPYLKELVALCLLEIIGVVILFVKSGFKYIPQIKNNSNVDETLIFMKEFIGIGTSATIVSNRVSWLIKNESLLKILNQKIEDGIKLEIITPSEVSHQIKSSIVGAIFIVTNENLPPEARFTLINGDRTGCEKLAIAKGVHPEHEITIFDHNSGPQIIAMAKDIIFKSKELAKK